MAKNQSKLAPWLTEDDEPSTKAEWLKEAKPVIDSIRVPNPDAASRALICLYEAVAAGK